MTLALRYAVRSDVGLLREGNEDSAYAGPHLLAVADGMGGYEAGEVASAAVISTVAPLDRRPVPESELTDALASAVSTAKDSLRRIVDADPAVGSMGTTLTALLWADGSAAICHIGDSRAYLLRDGDLYQITRDHTFVQALIDQGRIRPEEAATHPQRSLLLRALDGRTDADPDLSVLAAEVGDRFLICSDGLPVAVTDEAILEALAEIPEPADAVLKLIDLAIAGGGPDNITCIVADVIDTDRSQLKPTRAAVFAGAAAATSNGVHDTRTRPFDRPVLDEDGGLTRVGAVPAGHGTLPGLDGAPGQGTEGGRARQAGAAQARQAAEPEDEPPDARPRRRLPLVPLLVGLFVLVIAVGVLVLYEYANSQYYVGTSAGKVVIYRGLNEKVLGISIRSVYQRTPIPVAGIMTTDSQAISRAPTGSLSQARAFLATIRKDYQTCQNAYAAVTQWYLHRPKLHKVVVKGANGKPVLVHGKPETKLVRKAYRPKPAIPASCPAQPKS
jgi:PPM family protein phosphatase